MEYVLDSPIIFKFLKELEEEYNKVVNYIDVTDEWINSATPNSHTVEDLSYWIIDGIKYCVDGKSIVLDYSENEKECAEWLENTFGGEIYMCPRVNYPKNIETADYLWNNELWDKKGMSNSTSIKRAFDNAIKNHQEQAHNFIVDLTDSNLSNEIVIEQVCNAFIKNNKFYRDWLKKVIIKRDDKLIKVIIKK